MPSISPSYLYTFAALLVVSSLLVFSFVAYANAMRFSAETRQLRNLMDQVAGKSTELVALALSANTTSEGFVQIPPAIGDRQYWLQLRNNSENAWLESGLGNTPVDGSDMRVYLPKGVAATGRYIGGHGAAHLNCSLNGNVVELRLESQNEGS